MWPISQDSISISGFTLIWSNRSKVLDYLQITQQTFEWFKWVGREINIDGEEHFIKLSTYLEILFDGAINIRYVYKDDKKNGLIN